MCKLILIRSFMYTDSSRGLVFFFIPFSKESIMCSEHGKRKITINSRSAIQLLLRCMDMGAYVFVCVLEFVFSCAVNLDLKRIYVWLMSHEQCHQEQVGTYVRTRAGSLRSEPRSFIRTHILYMSLYYSLSHTSQNQTEPNQRGKKQEPKRKKNFFQYNTSTRFTIYGNSVACCSMYAFSSDRL